MWECRVEEIPICSLLQGAPCVLLITWFQLRSWLSCSALFDVMASSINCGENAAKGWEFLKAVCVRTLPQPASALAGDVAASFRVCKETRDCKNTREDFSKPMPVDFTILHWLKMKNYPQHQEDEIVINASPGWKQPRNVLLPSQRWIHSNGVSWNKNLERILLHGC